MCFCGNEIDEEEEKKISRVVCRASTLDIQKTLLGTCDERGDDWAEVVHARVLHVHDLPAADVIYHHVCSTNFRTKMGIQSYLYPTCLVWDVVRSGKSDDHNTKKPMKFFSR